MPDTIGLEPPVVMPGNTVARTRWQRSWNEHRRARKTRHAPPGDTLDPRHHRDNRAGRHLHDPATDEARLQRSSEPDRLCHAPIPAQRHDQRLRHVRRRRIDTRAEGRARGRRAPLQPHQPDRREPNRRSRATTPAGDIREPARTAPSPRSTSVRPRRRSTPRHAGGALGRGAGRPPRRRPDVTTGEVRVHVEP
jgi:hypothetical protein